MVCSQSAVFNYVSGVPQLQRLATTALQRAGEMAECHDATYHMPDLFPDGTVHHAAEIGSVKAIQQVEQQQKHLRGLPSLVVLEQRDELLQVLDAGLQKIVSGPGASWPSSYRSSG